MKIGKYAIAMRWHFIWIEKDDDALKIEIDFPSFGLHRYDSPSNGLYLFYKWVFVIGYISVYRNLTEEEKKERRINFLKYNLRGY